MRRRAALIAAPLILVLGTVGALWAPHEALDLLLDDLSTRGYRVVHVEQPPL